LPLPVSEAIFLNKVKTMTEKDVFKTENLVFVSKNGCVVGSLYFRAVEKNNVYRGRIRLYHESGPQISFREQPETTWLLVTEEGFNAYKTNRDKKSALSTVLADEIIGDLVSDFDKTISKAQNKKIYELYTHGRHHSRGVLIPVGSESGCITPLSQEQIDLLILQISSTNNKGNAKDADGKYDDNIVKVANDAIIKLTNDKDKYPIWIRQRKGEYGC
jgi:hypothetical protein